MAKEVKKIKIFDGHIKKDKFKTVRGEVTVKVIDKNGNIVDQQRSNTVVIYGRNAMFQRLTNVTYTVKNTAGQNINDARGYMLGFFAIGSGGASQSDPFNPTAPSQNDYKLKQYIYIGAASSTIAKDKIHKVVDHKQFASATEMVVTFTVDFTEANPGQNGNPDRVYVNEASLDLANNLSASNATSFIMFTRATFSTIEKTPDRKLEFEWHLYF